MKNFSIPKILSNFALAKEKGRKPNPEHKRSDARVAEEARLESVYTPKGYPEFESRSLRKTEIPQQNCLRDFLVLSDISIIYVQQKNRGQRIFRISGFSRWVAEMSRVQCCQSEHEEFDVINTAELSSESFDFRIEGFRRCIGEPPFEIVYYCGVVVLEGLQYFVEFIISESFHFIVPPGDIQSGDSGRSFETKISLIDIYLFCKFYKADS